MGIERVRELRRRRSRRKKVDIIKRRAKSATASEKSVLANKLRKMTPGANTIIDALELQDR